MTTLKNLLGTLLLSMPLVTACGDLDEASREQPLPASADNELAKVAERDGPTDLTINQPTINRLWGSSDKDLWGVGQGAMVVHWDGIRSAAAARPAARRPSLTEA